MLISILRTENRDWNQPGSRIQIILPNFGKAVDKISQISYIRRAFMASLSDCRQKSSKYILAISGKGTEYAENEIWENARRGFSKDSGGAARCLV